MSDKFYGKSEVERPGYSVLDLQELLNEKKSLEIRLSEQSALLEEMAEIFKTIKEGQLHMEPIFRHIEVLTFADNMLSKYAAFKEKKK